MLQKIFKNITKIELLLIWAIIILIILFSIFLIHNIQSAHRSWVFTNRTSVSEYLLKNKQASKTSLSDIEYIDTWMTFQYVNFIFKMPDDYLKNGLNIKNNNYPNLPIGRYIKNEKLDKTVVINRIKVLVREYIHLHLIQ